MLEPRPQRVLLACTGAEGILSACTQSSQLPGSWCLPPGYLPRYPPVAVVYCCSHGENRLLKRKPKVAALVLLSAGPASAEAGHRPQARISFRPQWQHQFQLRQCYRLLLAWPCCWQHHLHVHMSKGIVHDPVSQPSLQAAGACQAQQRVLAARLDNLQTPEVLLITVRLISRQIRCCVFARPHRLMTCQQILNTSLPGGILFLRSL